MIDATPLLRAYARLRRRRLAAHLPREVQQAELLRLVRRAARTRFGLDHDFGRIASVADFQSAVPLRRYDDFRSEYWRASYPVLEDVTWPGRIPYFAVSSGTTSDVTKRIPVSREMVRSNTRAGLDLLVHHLEHRPKSRIMGGLNFMLGGSTDLIREAHGVHSGDISGIAASEIPFWARSRYFPPLDLALISDWEEKVERMSGAAIDVDIRSMGGTPSWMLILIDRMFARTGADTLPQIFPNLEMVVHGGVNFAPYVDRFQDLLEGGAAELREVYAASEGFVASADKGYGEGLRLNQDIGLFYEFVPVDELDSKLPTRHWIDDAERGVNYALAVSNCAGAWAYLLGDTVRLVSTDPPRVLVTGRTAYTLNAFGEHVINEELEQAVSEAAADIGTNVTDFAAGAIFPSQDDSRGGHVFIVEFDAVTRPEDTDAFASALDRSLCSLNEDYQAHRGGDFGMQPPVVHVLAAGGFAEWMKQKGKLGGQHKVPRVIEDREKLEDLIAFARDRMRPG